MEPAGADARPQVPDRAGWVLVCDDTESIRLLLRINLELAGFEVIEAADGEAALALLTAAGDNLPSVVILDAQMCPRDGWWAIKQIRRTPELADLPVVMVTAALQQHERDRASGAGMDAFVPKPFDPDALIDLVQGFAAEGRQFSSPDRP
jgi:CheY-like chemotaxis protein